MYEIYQVMNAGTLEDIARVLGLNVQDLMEINGIPSNAFFEAGSYVIIPRGQNQDFKTYTVQAGDTIISIARKYNLDYKQLLDLNGLNSEEYLYIGQQILIPNDNTFFWITGDNDTLNDIADKFDVSIDEVINSNKNIFLRPDQMLIIKKKD